jgi:hypothetical protein
MNRTSIVSVACKAASQVHPRLFRQFLSRTSENSVYANFAECPECELRRYGVLRSSRQVLTAGTICTGAKRPPTRSTSGKKE